MGSRVHRIKFYGRDNVEASLLKSERHTAGTSKQVDSNWPRHADAPIVIRVVIS